MQLTQARLEVKTPFFQLSRWVRTPFQLAPERWQPSRCFEPSVGLESQNIWSQQHVQPQEKREGAFVFTHSSNFDIFFL